MRDDLVGQIDDSVILGKDNPHRFLNERNAIILNCRDSKIFNEVYEKVIEKHFK